MKTRINKRALTNHAGCVRNGLDAELDFDIKRSQVVNRIFFLMYSLILFSGCPDIPYHNNKSDSSTSQPGKKNPPTVSLYFSGPHAGNVFGDQLAGSVTIRAFGERDAKGIFIDILEPKEISTAKTIEGGVELTINADFAPQLSEAARQCGLEVGKGRLAGFNNGSAQVCVCATATDELGQTGKDILCFTRSKPTIKIKSPNTTILSAGLLKSSPNVEIEAESGFHFSSCFWQLSTANEGDGIEPVLKGAGKLTGNICSVSHFLNFEKLEDGEYFLSMAVTDVAGQTIKEKQRISLSRTVPDLIIQNPNHGFVTNADIVSFTGKEPVGKELDWVKIRWWAGNNPSVVREVAGVRDELGNWVSSFNHLDEGIYSYEVSFEDKYGNEGRLPLRNWIIDRTPPRILTHKDGVEQALYIPEWNVQNIDRLKKECNIDYIRCTKLRSDEKPKFINWSDPKAVIRRWATHLNEDTSAPRYQVSAVDQFAEQIKINWSLDENCVDSKTDQNEFYSKSGQTVPLMLTARRANANLMQADFEVGKNLCLSVFATDDAGNTARESLTFKWATSTAPLEHASRTWWDEYDPLVLNFANSDRIDSLFKGSIPGGLVFASVILFNGNEMTARIKVDERKKQFPVLFIKERNTQFYKEHFLAFSQRTLTHRYFRCIDNKGKANLGCKVAEEIFPDADGYVELEALSAVVIRYFFSPQKESYGFESGSELKIHAMRLANGVSEKGKEIDVFKKLENWTRIDEKTSDLAGYALGAVFVDMGGAKGIISLVFSSLWSDKRR